MLDYLGITVTKQRRGQQFSGLNGDADVVDVPYLHVECKAQETMHLYDWMEQAKRDAGKNGRIPCVIHKKNNHDILVTMCFHDFMTVYKEFEASWGMNNDKDRKGTKSFKN